MPGIGERTAEGTVLLEAWFRPRARLVRVQIWHQLEYLSECQITAVAGIEAARSPPAGPRLGAGDSRSRRRWRRRCRPPLHVRGTERLGQGGAGVPTVQPAGLGQGAGRMAPGVPCAERQASGGDGRVMRAVGRAVVSGSAWRGCVMTHRVRTIRLRGFRLSAPASGPGDSPSPESEPIGQLRHGHRQPVRRQNFCGADS